MPTIGYRDLQYRAEIDYYQKLRRLLDGLRDKYAKFAEQERTQEAEFYRLLGRSLKISEAPRIREVIDQVKGALRVDCQVHIFVTTFPTAQAMCTPRSTYGKGKAGEPVLIVSQHFLNELEPVEQHCIIGHELGHILFHHAFIPAKTILAFPFRLGDVGPLKIDVLKWMTCSEVSCDLLGLVAGNRRTDAFIHGVIKFTTGLHQAGLASLGGEGLATLLRGQFKQLTSCRQAEGLTTHPVMLLRATIAEGAAKTRLIQHFGEQVAENTWREYKQEFNESIDELVRKVYPEIPTREPTRTEDILFDMSLAVVLADGRLEPGELAGLTRLSVHRRDLREILARTQRELRAEGHQSVIQKLIRRALSAAVGARMTAAQATSVTRQLLLIAASDGLIGPRELEVILQFSSRFGLTLQHLVRMIGVLRLR